MYANYKTGFTVTKSHFKVRFMFQGSQLLLSNSISLILQLSSLLK